MSPSFFTYSDLTSLSVFVSLCLCGSSVQDDIMPIMKYLPDWESGWPGPSESSPFCKTFIYYDGWLLLHEGQMGGQLPCSKACFMSSLPAHMMLYVSKHYLYFFLLILHLHLDKFPEFSFYCYKQIWKRQTVWRGPGHRLYIKDGLTLCDITRFWRAVFEAQMRYGHHHLGSFGGINTVKN